MSLELSRKQSHALAVVQGPVVSAAAVEARIGGKIFSKFKHVQAAFKIFDSDKSGSITHDEFRRALALTCGFVMSDEVRAGLLVRWFAQ